MKDDEEFSPEFLDLVDALTYPKPPPSATLRVAEVHFGEGRFAPAIESAGMILASTLDGQKDLPDFETMEPFDIALVDVPSSPGDWEKATDYMMRFVRVRRPVAFVILGCVEEELRRLMEGKSQPYGYEVGGSRQDELDFIAGVSIREPDQVVWDALHRAVRQIRDEIEAGG